MQEHSVQRTASFYRFLQLLLCNNVLGFSICLIIWALVCKETRSFSHALQFLICAPLAITFPSATHATTHAQEEPKAAVALRLETSQDKVGVELYDVNVGNPPRLVVAIKKIVSNDNPNLRPGLVLKGYPNALAVVERIRRGPYPIDLEFYSLDSLATTQLVEGGTKTATQAPVADNNTYVKRVVREAPADCTIRLQQDDVLEINYKAHISSMDGVMYDASSTRGMG